MENCNVVEDVKEIRQTMSKIETALIGNEYNPKGLLKRVENNEREIKEMIETFQKFRDSINKVKYVSLGYALGGTGLGFAILKLFS